MSVQYLSLCSAPTGWDSLSALQTFWPVRASPSRKENQGLCVIIMIYRSFFISIYLFLTGTLSLYFNSQYYQWSVGWWLINRFILSQCLSNVSGHLFFLFFFYLCVSVFLQRCCPSSVSSERDTNWWRENKHSASCLSRSFPHPTLPRLDSHRSKTSPPHHHVCWEGDRTHRRSLGKKPLLCKYSNTWNRETLRQIWWQCIAASAFS